MINIQGIQNGVVIDHIRAGFGMNVLEYLGLKEGNEMVALIMNAKSSKHGRKDIIKLTNIDNVNLDILGLVDQTATVNYIKDGEIYDKKHPSLPPRVDNIFKCKNPRCVTSIEQVPHTFVLVTESGMYRCMYCDDLQAGLCA